MNNFKYKLMDELSDRVSDIILLCGMQNVYDLEYDVFHEDDEIVGYEMLEDRSLTSEEDHDWCVLTKGTDDDCIRYMKYLIHYDDESYEVELYYGNNTGSVYRCYPNLVA